MRHRVLWQWFFFEVLAVLVLIAALCFTIGYVFKRLGPIENSRVAVVASVLVMVGLCFAIGYMVMRISSNDRFEITLTLLIMCFAIGYMLRLI